MSVSPMTYLMATTALDRKYNIPLLLYHYNPCFFFRTTLIGLELFCSEEIVYLLFKNHFTDNLFLGLVLLQLGQVIKFLK